MMKVTVTKFLNVRVGKPELNAPCYQYIAPGSILEVDDELLDGDSFDGTSKWLKDRAGNFYWAGGTNFSAIGKESPDAKVNVLDYNQLIEGIPEDVRATKGAGITVCVMDTGCFEHTALSGVIVGRYSTVDGSTNTEDGSVMGHGTFVSGLIATAKLPNAEMSGIAPEVQLSVVKITDRNDPVFVHVLSALEWLNTLPKPPAIVNMSFSLSLSDGDRSVIAHQIDLLVRKNVLVVAAAGNDDALFRDDDILFPANLENVIAIGSLSQASLSKNLNSHVSRFVNYVLPHHDYISLRDYGNGYRKVNNNNGRSSFATALATGVLALFESHSPQSAILEINNSIEPLSGYKTNGVFKLYKP